MLLVRHDCASVEEPKKSLLECVFHSHLWYENRLVARRNHEDARWLAKGQACTVPSAESILNKFEERGDITYRAQFIDLLREYNKQRELERKRKEESELPGSPKP